MGKLIILNHTGDEQIEWDVNQPDSILSACKKFLELRSKGYLIYKVINGDEVREFDPNVGPLSAKSGEQINEFEPEAKEIIATPPMVGG